jgi:hypothetical protein
MCRGRSDRRSGWLPGAWLGGSRTYFTAPDASEQFGDAIATTDGTTVVAGRYSEAGSICVYEL